MKKNISILLFTFTLMCSSSNGQGLSNWKHYYKPFYYNYDFGNQLAAVTGGELITFDKSTFAITRIPMPPDMRELNVHNSRFYDSSAAIYYTYLPALAYGPNNTILLRTKLVSPDYIYDGSNWIPTTNYLGFGIDSISFLPYKGGSNFFRYKYKLYKYNGATLSFFDSTNSPYNPLKYFRHYSDSNDNIYLVSSYSIAIYRNSTWSVYDTTFFGVHYLNTSTAVISPTGDFNYTNAMDSTLNTFSHITGNWTTTPVPSTVIHSTSGLNVTNAWYDTNDDLWLMGYGVFCRFDGSQFYDYFNNIYAVTNSMYASYITSLSGGNIMISVNNNYLIYNAISNTATPLPPDPRAKLTGNYLLPILKDIQGNIWIGSYDSNQKNGLMKFDGFNWSYPDLESHGISDGIYCIEQDTGNSIIFGYGEYSSNGPVRLSDTNFIFLTAAGQYTDQVKDIAKGKNNHYWFGGRSNSSGLADLYQGNISYHPLGGSHEVYAIEIDTLNNKWVSFYSFDGVYKINGPPTHYDKSNSPLPNDTVIDIKIDQKTNSVWFCTAGGFAKLYNGIWTIYNMSNSPLPSNDCEYVYFGDDSTIWFATQAGFASLKDTVWNVYTVNTSPLTLSDIESIAIDDNCNIWLCADGGLNTATLPCGLPKLKVANGTAVQWNNSPAQNALIYVYKLNAAGIEYDQIDNIFTDSTGHFSYFATDSGLYNFMIAENELLFPGQMPAYPDSALVVQQATPVNITANGNYPVNIKMQNKVSSWGTLSLKGKLQSVTERTGSVRLILMLNNQPVASVLSNIDGTFWFKNIAAATYTIWVDKLGLNNSVAPSVTINNPSYLINRIFDLYVDHLSLASVGINNHDLNSNINIFPNPFTQQVSISIQKQNLKSATLEIKNLLGQTIYHEQEKLSGNSFNKTLDLSFLQNGIYFLELNLDGERIVKKIIKQ